MKDYAKLKELLESVETFPHRFVYKFIGRNTPAFARSVERFVAAHPELALELTRESSGGKHVSMTYSFEAPDADSIIEIFRSIEGLEDLMVVL